MKTEKNYDFLKRMQVIHKPNRRKPHALPKDHTELLLDSTWEILLPFDASPLMIRAAKDLQDYLFTSMDLSLPIHKGKDQKKRFAITFRIDPALEGRFTKKKGSFLLDVGDEYIQLSALEDRGIFYGSLRMEDLMNFREAPILTRGETCREPLLRMRSIHSGSGIDDYPDWQLNAIAHAGFTAIDVFIKDIDITTRGYCNVNDVIDRAASYGLDTVLYNYIKCYKHPDDADAEAFFDAIYGKVAAAYPKAAAIHMVGESLDFPSKDPHTSGKPWRASMVDGIPDTRPSPGWYPCYDYPAYLKRVVDSIHKVNPDLEVIFNTYNCGWVDSDIRRDFLAKMPKELTIHATFDIFRMIVRGDLKCPVMDYSAVAAEPGEYFHTEVKNASSLGFRTRATTNTGGLTWDFGCIPYEPIPFRFARRMLKLKEYTLSCGLDSFYETHHYGWWPNPANDIAKEVFFTDGEADLEKVCTKIAVREYGEEAANSIVQAWHIWSDAMDNYVASNEDQYGPWRVGPAYPFIFHPNITRTMGNKEIDFPTAPHAHFGGRIVKTFYHPYENENQTPGPLRYPVDLQDLARMKAQWKEGLALVEKAIALMPDCKKENGEYLYGIGKFILNSICTVIHIKQWYLENIQLAASSNRPDMLKHLDNLEAIAKAEESNVKDTVAVVTRDSRLGWEPSMEYVCDPWHLDWKLRQMESMKREMATFRKTVLL